MKIAQVIIDKATPAYDRIYDYALPRGRDVLAGSRVVVPFGRSNKSRVGLVLSVYEGENPNLKAILSVIDKEYLLNAEGIKMAQYLYSTTFCSRFDGVKCQIPPGAGIKVSIGVAANKGLNDDELSDEGKTLYAFLQKKRKAMEEHLAKAGAGLDIYSAASEELLTKGFATRVQIVRQNILDQKSVMARIISDIPPNLPEKQQRVVDLLQNCESASVKEICYFSAVGKGVVDTLSKKGIIELYEEIVVPPKVSHVKENVEPIKLSPHQTSAYNIIFPTLNAGGISLLRGITGSGKTQVFLKLIDHCLEQNKTALVLIPEIALTPQMVDRFKERYSTKVALLNSGLSMTQRLEQYQKIKTGECTIVVGTRSAVFAPLENIGLIVIDEEQEHTYHSESAPRYHARTIAQMRAKYHNCALMLCSATPSLESFYNATNGKYVLANLNERYFGNELPAVEIIDMRECEMAAPSISQKLANEIEYNVTNNEQTILLLNRRGHSTMLRCSACSEVIKCPNCSVALTYHTANGRLVCHSCGHSVGEPNECPTCKNPMLRYTGAGTQRAFEELSELFPNAKILRMDADSTMSKNSHERGFSAFARGEYDIMIGTQMVSKGLDFKNVTLVGVLAADQSLYSEDFRSFERTFSLICQCVGRCGRGDKAGRAYIQTFSPENSVLELASTQDYEDFYKEEIAFRKAAIYPPFCNIVSVAFSNESEHKTLEDAKVFGEMIKALLGGKYPKLPIVVLGPTQKYPYKVSNKYRMQLLIKCRLDKNTYIFLRELYDSYYKLKDMSPMTIDTFFE